MKADIRLEKGNADVAIDGNKMSFISAINVYGRADGINTVTLDLVLHDFDVTADGELVINARPVTDEVGRAIYESLKLRYETDLA